MMPIILGFRRFGGYQRVTISFWSAPTWENLRIHNIIWIFGFGGSKKQWKPSSEFLKRMFPLTPSPLTLRPPEFGGDPQIQSGVAKKRLARRRLVPPCLSEFVRNCPTLSGVVRNCLELSEKYQELLELLLNCPGLSGSVRNCPEPSPPGESLIDFGVIVFSQLPTSIEVQKSSSDHGIS